MSPQHDIDKNEFLLLRNYIEKHCGISLGDDKMYLVQTRLTALMVENGCRTFTEFYHLANDDATGRLRNKIIDAMTTNETLWFRDGVPYSILEDAIFPALAPGLAKRTAPLRIWSAACSTGQEPYSIAMTVLECARKGTGIQPGQIEIIGTDISTAALFLARAGRYDEMSMSRGMREEIKNRYFDRQGSVWVIRDSVRRMVTFQPHNLQDSFFNLGKFYIIFCRNVLIYFSDEFKKDILNKITRALVPGGYLFIGGPESLIGFGAQFQTLTHKKGLYYQAKNTTPGAKKPNNAVQTTGAKNL